MLIEAFGLGGYRSFGNEGVRIGPFEKVNLIIGRNNSGKSNVVTFLRDIYRSFMTSAKAFIVMSMSSLLCALDTKPASKADGAR